MNGICIVLIGMSNIGKSYWAKLLEALGYTRVSADVEIGRKLKRRFPGLDFSDTEVMSNWMGQPTDTRYTKNAALYRKYEKQVMWSIIWRILKGEKLVVDTTGSVIYTGWLVLWVLRTLTTVVLLDAPSSLLEEMREKYFAEPKPVLWGEKGEIFVPFENEDGVVAMRRCYPNLQRTRNVKYHKTAHVVLSPVSFQKPGFTAYELMQCIREAT